MTQSDDSDDDRHEQRRYTEFDCPQCNAHNPCDDGFGQGDEVLCFYCGTSFLVRNVEGRLKFKEV